MRLGHYLSMFVVLVGTALADEEPLPAGGLTVSAPGYSFRTPGPPWQYQGGFTSLAEFARGDGMAEFALPGSYAPLLHVQPYRWFGRWDGARPAAENLMAEMAFRLELEGRRDPLLFHRLVNPRIESTRVNGAPCIRWEADVVAGALAPSFDTGRGRQFGQLCSHPEFPGFAVEMTASDANAADASLHAPDREAFFASLAFTPLKARLTELRLAGRPWHLAEGAGALWVLETGSSGQCCDGMSVVRIDPATNAIVARIAAGKVGQVLADPHGIWVFGDKRLVRIDPATNRIAGSIAIPKRSTNLAAGGGYLWVIDSATDRLVRIDPESGTKRSFAGFGKSLGEIAVMDHTVYVSRWWEDGFLAVDVETGSITHTLVARRFPFVLRVQNGRLWAINNNDETLQNAILSFDPIKSEAIAFGDVAPLEPLDLAWWNGKLAVMTADALAIINPDTRTSYMVPIPCGDSNGVEVAGGALWVAGASSLVRIDPK